MGTYHLQKTSKPTNFTGLQKFPVFIENIGNLEYIGNIGNLGYIGNKGNKGNKGHIGNIGNKTRYSLNLFIQYMLWCYEGLKYSLHFYILTISRKIQTIIF